MNNKNHYSTENGVCFLGDCENIIKSKLIKKYKGMVHLIFTSPPFPLNRKKKYGNRNGQEYIDWFANLGEQLKELLSPNGSIVIEMGNAWNPGEPTFSTLPMEALLEFKNRNNLYLCQEFIYYNPARLPSPIQWVNIKRTRVKDSFSRFWWLSNTPTPYANNKNILVEYSKQMKKLLATGKYNSGLRPSEHSINEDSFKINNGGAIPSNVIIAANTDSSSCYLKKCKEHEIALHPARMPVDLPNFFIKFLTNEGDIVLDCFAGSNTTGFCAETLNRKWLSIEADSEYFNGSKFRF